jgi:outer membrane protein assembly factor BamA
VKSFADQEIQTSGAKIILYLKSLAMVRIAFVLAVLVTVGATHLAFTQESAPRPEQYVKVVSVKLEGVDTLPQPVLKSAEDAVERTVFRLSEVSERTRAIVKRTLVWAGYRDATVEAPRIAPAAGAARDANVKSVNLTVRADAGDQYHISGVAIAGTQAVTPQEVRDLIPLHPGDVDDIGKMLRALAEIRKLYACNGYIKAVPVPLVDIHHATRTSYLTVEMREGRRYAISSVNLAGFDDGTTEKLLTAPGLQTGEAFSSCRIKASVDEWSGAARRPFVIEVAPDDQTGKVAVVLRATSDSQRDGEVVERATPHLLK